MSQRGSGIKPHASAAGSARRAFGLVLCPNCGYDLRGAVGADPRNGMIRCPECGDAVDLAAATLETIGLQFPRGAWAYLVAAVPGLLVFAFTTLLPHAAFSMFFDDWGGMGFVPRDCLLIASHALGTCLVHSLLRRKTRRQAWIGMLAPMATAVIIDAAAPGASMLVLMADWPVC